MTIRNSLPFAMIPEWLLDSDVSAQAVRLYCVLHRYADKDTQHAHPSRRALAKRLRCSPDTIDRSLKELVEIGAVEVKHRHVEDDRQTSNDYILRPGGRTDAAGGGGMDAAGGAAQMRHQELEPLELEPVEREKSILSEVTFFDMFWSVYPRHQDRARATKALDKALRKTDLETIVAGAIRYRDDPNREDGFTLHPTTWLNQERWNDDPLPVRRSRPKRVSQMGELMRQAVEG